MLNNLNFPVPISIYRGHSKEGFGEGKGRAISSGSQFLRKSDVADLNFDPSFLDYIRPWISLNSNASDHKKLHDHLEGWCSFQYQRYYCIARMRSAGEFDRRAAHFSHAYLWQKKECDAVPGFDPAAYLGNMDLFDAPWRAGEPCEKEARLLAWPTLDANILSENAEAIIKFITWFYTAVDKKIPLVIAAPLGLFEEGSGFMAMISFARAALPENFKRACSIRVYVRSAGDFMQQVSPNITVIPDDEINDVLQSNQKIILLDHHGNLQSGGEIPKAANTYAQCVVKRMQCNKDAVFLFSHRIAQRANFPEVQKKKIPFIVDFCFNLAELEQAWNIPKIREGIIHSDLLEKETTDVAYLAVKRLMTEYKESADLFIKGWNPNADQHKMDVLLDLFLHKPPLISRDTVVSGIKDIQMKVLAESRCFAEILNFEKENNNLMRWNRMETKLVEHAIGDETILAFLQQVTSESLLSSGWAKTFLGKASEEQLCSFALYLLDHIKDWSNWGDIPGRLFDKILRWDRKYPAVFLDTLKQQSSLIDIKRYFAIYITLAEIVEKERSNASNPLIDALLKESANTKDKNFQESLVKSARSSKYRSLELTSFFGDNGLPKSDFTWLNDFANQLLLQENRTFLVWVEGNYLFTLASRVKEREENLCCLFEIIDERIIKHDERKKITKALVKHAWWYFWVLQSKLSKAERRQTALAWMSRELWEGTSKLRADIPMEAWTNNMEVIGSGTLVDEEAKDLSWPIIPFFKTQQYESLAKLPTTLGGLVVLYHQAKDKALATLFFDSSSFKSNPKLSCESFLLLAEERDGVISCDEAIALLNCAGIKKITARKILGKSIVQVCFFDKNGRDQDTAIQYASDYNLWQECFFLEEIDSCLGKGTSKDPSKAVIKAMVEGTNGRDVKKYHNIKNIVEKNNKDKCYQTLANLIIEGRSSAKEWGQFATLLNNCQQNDDENHPLRRLEQVYRLVLNEDSKKKQILTACYRTLIEGLKKSNIQERKLYCDNSTLPFDLLETMAPKGERCHAMLHYLKNFEKHPVEQKKNAVFLYIKKENIQREHMITNIYRMCIDSGLDSDWLLDDLLIQSAFLIR